MPKKLSRRNAIKGIGLSAGTLGVVGSTSFLFSESASADFSVGDFSGLNDVSITSDDGSVNWVATKAAMLATWNGFETDVHYFRFIDRVVIAPNSSSPDEYTINDTGAVPDGGMGDGRQDGEWGGDSGWHGWQRDSDGGEDYSDVGRAGYVHADIDWGIIQKNRENIYNDSYPLPNNPAPTSRLENSEDGTTKDTAVRFIKQVRLYDENKNPLTGPNGPTWGPSDAKIVGEFVVSVTNEAAMTTGSGDNDGTTGNGDDEDSLS